GDQGHLGGGGVLLHRGDNVLRRRARRRPGGTVHDPERHLPARGRPRDFVKHFDAGLGHTEVRRSRRLVVSFIITAGNYEYAFYWYFYQDASIELEVKLTGIVLTSALPPGETSDYGTVVAPQTLAAHHQHFFGARLDMAVDGDRNSVLETETEPAPKGPDNPYGNAFRPRRTLLRSESQAQRLIDPLTGRHWLVINPNVTNGLGQ